MENKRFQVGGRRENNVIPNFPFKDSNGVTVKECRRKIPGRRMIMIHGKWIDELGMSVDGGQRRKDTMSKTDCKMKLKHQLEIGRRLHQLGLFEAAAESRTKARVLLQIYKRHFREQVINQR